MFIRNKNAIASWITHFFIQNNVILINYIYIVSKNTKFFSSNKNKIDSVFGDTAIETPELIQKDGKTILLKDDYNSNPFGSDIIFKELNNIL